MVAWEGEVLTTRHIARRRRRRRRRRRPAADGLIGAIGDREVLSETTNFVDVLPCPLAKCEVLKRDEGEARAGQEGVLFGVGS